MYTLYFPFELASDQKISGVKYTEQLGDIVFSLQGHDRFYELIVSGFSSQQIAEQYVNVLWAGLMWVLLNQEVSFRADLNLQQITDANDPYQAAEKISKNFGIPVQGKVDGIICRRQPVVWSSDNQIILVEAEIGEPFTTTPAGNIFTFLREGVAFPYSCKVSQNAKLKTALELYAAYFMENSLNTKFLTLVIALEALSARKPRPEYTRNLLDKWLKEAREIQQGLDPSSDEYLSLHSLISDGNFRKYESISSQIRALVYDTLLANGDPDAADVARRTMKVYQQRSTLVHQGTLAEQELRVAVIDAKIIVERVLKAQFCKIASTGVEQF